MELVCAEQISLVIANVKLRDQLRDQSIRDVLTGLFNRRYMLETCRREFSRAARAGQSISILSIDIDHFKKYNDNHGHVSLSQQRRHWLPLYPLPAPPQRSTGVEQRCQATWRRESS